VRVQLLAGSRVLSLSLDDDVELLLSPRPAQGVGSTEAAVRDALRFPLAGPSLEEVAPSTGRVTIVLDAAALPIPSPDPDPRRIALAATVEELERLGVATERMTILVAGGLCRRLGAPELEARLPPTLARRFEGAVVSHDAESPDLVVLGEQEGTPLLVAPALVEADAVVVVTSAETVDDGGASAFLAASSAAALRAVAGTGSLLEAGDTAWQRALAIERELGRHVPLIGVSLALGQPTWGGPLKGFPYRRGRVARVARSPALRTFGLLPAAARRRILFDLRPEIAVQAVFAGVPSVAHAEALLRGIEIRSLALERRFDALVVGMPPLTPTPPLERPNPLNIAYLGLGLALRLWRGAPPLVDGGTLIFAHRLHRRFAHPTQAPYRTFFAALRGGEGREPENLAAAERAAAEDPVALGAYRAGRTCHPLLPFAEWEACTPARRRLGSVLVAGCRDATAARLLGFVPVRNVPTALDWVRAAGGPAPAIGCLPTPPFPPLVLAR
jgi:hypothetical protein